MGHRSWVLVAEWSPLGTYLASGGMDNLVIIWDMKTHKIHGKKLQGHRKWVTAVSWRPLHIDSSETFVVSSSKDFSIRIWNARKSALIAAYQKHTASVTGVIWTG